MSAYTDWSEVIDKLDADEEMVECGECGWVGDEIELTAGCCPECGRCDAIFDHDD